MMRTRSLSFAAMLGLVLFSQVAYSFQKEKMMNEDFFSAVTGGDVSRVREMVRVDPTLARASDAKGVSALLNAVYYRKKEMTEFLLSTGLELNVFEAAATGQIDRLRTLLKKDASLANAYSADGFTPLGLAAFFGQRSAVEALLSAGADVNQPSKETMKLTPLHSATAAREVSIARLLIAKGANVNARQAELGFTPLHEAAANGHIEFALLLLENGAEINSRTKDGKTPLKFAVDRNESEMASFLRSRGAHD